MKKLKELANGVKFWIAFAVVVIGSLTAVGATVDRPAWFSEVNAIAEDVAANSKAILQNETDAVQRRVWDQEDRQKTTPTEDGLRRLRELREQLRRLLERLKTKG